MLKRYTFIIIALLLAVSCREKDNDKDNPGEISATMSIRDTGSGFQWKEGDKVKVVAVGSSSTSYAVLENRLAGEQAFFSGDITVNDEEFTAYAMAPVSAFESAASRASVNINVPASQSPLANGPDPAADILVSEPCNVIIEDGEASGAASFSRLTSIVKVVPSGFPSERVRKISVNFGTDVAGAVSVDLSQKKAGFAGVGSKNVSASFSESFIMNGTNGAYLSIVPATLSAGASIVVTVRTDTRDYVKTLKAGEGGVPATFAAGQTVSLAFVLQESDAVNETALKVMSFNIKAGYDGETGEHCWSNRKVGQKMMMADIDPDIVALQEVDAPQRDYYKTNITGYTYVTVTTGAQSGGDYKKCGCNQIGFRTSRFTLLDKGWYWLSETPDQESKGYQYDGYLSAIYARLLDNESGRTIVVVSTHIASGDNNPSREFTSRLVVERTKQFVADEDEVVFVMGDMNAANYKGSDIKGYPGYRQSIQAFYDWMTDSRSVAKQIVNDYSLNGYGAWTKHVTLNIDMIFYRNVKSADCFTTVTQPYNNTEYISDHYPVVLDCKY